MIDQFFIAFAGEFDQPGKNLLGGQELPLLVCENLRCAPAERDNGFHVAGYIAAAGGEFLRHDLGGQAHGVGLGDCFLAGALDRLDDAIGADVQARGELLKSCLLSDLLRAFGAGVVQVPRDLID